MSNAEITLLIDTNVWIDYFSPWRQGHELACTLFAMSVERGIDLLFAVSSSKDVYYQVQMSYKLLAKRCDGALTEERAVAARETAWGCVRWMGEVANPVGCDMSDMWLAQKHKTIHADYEDDLVIAAAIRSKATQLVTNDRSLIIHAPVSALSVEDALAYVETL